MSNDLERLAKLHAKAFDRLRVLEGKVAAIQAGHEDYAHSVGQWMNGLCSVLHCIDPDHLGRFPTVNMMIERLADTIPHMEHTHVFLWGSRAGLPRGVGECACGEQLDYMGNGNNDLYDNSLGSTANQRGQRKAPPPSAPQVTEKGVK